jgi:hypothetical protein
MGHVASELELLDKRAVALRRVPPAADSYNSRSLVGHRSGACGGEERGTSYGCVLEGLVVVQFS